MQIQLIIKADPKTPVIAPLEFPHGNKIPNKNNPAVGAPKVDTVEIQK